MKKFLLTFSVLYDDTLPDNVQQHMMLDSVFMGSDKELEWSHTEQKAGQVLGKLGFEVYGFKLNSQYILTINCKLHIVCTNECSLQLHHYICYAHTFQEYAYP